MISTCWKLFKLKSRIDEKFPLRYTFVFGPGVHRYLVSNLANKPDAFIIVITIIMDLLSIEHNQSLSKQVEIRIDFKLTLFNVTIASFSVCCYARLWTVFEYYTTEIPAQLLHWPVNVTHLLWQIHSYNLGKCNTEPQITVIPLIVHAQLSGKAISAINCSCTSTIRYHIKIKTILQLLLWCKMLKRQHCTNQLVSLGNSVSLRHLILSMSSGLIARKQFFPLFLNIFFLVHNIMGVVYVYILIARPTNLTWNKEKKNLLRFSCWNPTVGNPKIQPATDTYAQAMQLIFILFFLRSVFVSICSWFGQHRYSPSYLVVVTVTDVIFLAVKPYQQVFIADYRIFIPFNYFCAFFCGS